MFKRWWCSLQCPGLGCWAAGCLRGALLTMGVLWLHSSYLTRRAVRCHLAVTRLSFCSSDMDRSLFSFKTGCWERLSSFMCCAKSKLVLLSIPTLYSCEQHTTKSTAYHSTSARVQVTFIHLTNTASFLTARKKLDITLKMKTNPMWVPAFHAWFEKKKVHPASIQCFIHQWCVLLTSFHQLTNTSRWKHHHRQA